MKSLINVLGLIIAVFSIQLKTLAQIYYPSATFFNPTASLFRGSNENIKKWLEVHDAGFFASLIANSMVESELLNNKEKTITLIAPIDEAFHNLLPEEKDKLSEIEEANKLIKYHLIPGIISEDEIKNQRITTLDGKSITIQGMILEDGSEKIVLNNNSKIQKIEKISSNLIVVLIDQVLVPENLVE